MSGVSVLGALDGANQPDAMLFIKTQYVFGNIEVWERFAASQWSDARDAFIADADGAFPAFCVMNA
jgi:hypothetical protein